MTAIGGLLRRLLGHGKATPPDANERDFAEALKRNLLGRDLERQGRENEAIELYEDNVRAGFIGSHPYERLRVIYTRNKDFASALRVCEAYIGAAGSHDPSAAKVKRFRESAEKLRSRARV